VRTLNPQVLQTSPLSCFKSFVMKEEKAPKLRSPGVNLCRRSRGEVPALDLAKDRSGPSDQAQTRRRSIMEKIISHPSDLCAGECES
jgi:hypothetical protein